MCATYHDLGYTLANSLAVSLPVYIRITTVLGPHIWTLYIRCVFIYSLYDYTTVLAKIILQLYCITRRGAARGDGRTEYRSADRRSVFYIYSPSIYVNTFKIVEITTLCL